MGIGADIKDIFADVGSAITIIRDSGTVTGEYLDSEINRQITKPFVANYFRNASFQYDTEIIAGDVIQFEVDDTRHLVMSKRAEAFENEVVTWEGTLYLCNVSGELSRPTSTRSAQTYHREETFEPVKSTCHALMTEALYGHDLETDEELGLMGLENHELYIPASVGPQILDRYEGASGEYSMIATIKKRRYENVLVCGLEVDTR
uniref:Uncharacterized protein n=1 Tax=viral metagenome TaxID=1070528 RepID=A0A6H1ZAI6_9ZZZZ